jgi:hypothetical protein
MRGFVGSVADSFTFSESPGVATNPPVSTFGALERASLIYPTIAANNHIYPGYPSTLDQWWISLPGIRVGAHLTTPTKNGFTEDFSIRSESPVIDSLLHGRQSVRHRRNMLDFVCAGGKRNFMTQTTRFNPCRPLISRYVLADLHRE